MIALEMVLTYDIVSSEALTDGSVMRGRASSDVE